MTVDLQLSTPYTDPERHNAHRHTDRRQYRVNRDRLKIRRLVLHS